jgi:hypothetical protein
MPDQVSLRKEETAMSKVIRNQSHEAALMRQLIMGTTKHFPNGSQQLTVGGAAFTVTALTALLQSFVDQREAVDASKAATKAKIEAERAQAPSRRGVVSAFVAYVKATFGNSPDLLADFGLSPRKARTALSAEQKAVAVAKRDATRAARHTMGTKQRKGVKGSVKVTVTKTPLAEPQPIAVPTAPSGASTPHA